MSIEELEYKRWYWFAPNAIIRFRWIEHGRVYGEMLQETSKGVEYFKHHSVSVYDLIRRARKGEVEKFKSKWIIEELGK